jgi:hypothetical protein
MAKFINLTPHSVQVYDLYQFKGLKEINPTTLVADGVEGDPILDLPSEGVARISCDTERDGSHDGIPMFKTEYGELTGITPEHCLASLSEDVRFIVSLPTKGMAQQAGHPLASRMVSPFRVVRSSQNGSIVLGCMGFTS